MTKRPPEKRTITSYTRKRGLKRHGVSKHSRRRSRRDAYMEKFPVEMRPTYENDFREKAAKAKARAAFLRAAKTKTAATRKKKKAVGKPEQPKHGTGIPAMKAWFAPYPHQKEAINKLMSNDGKLILAHGTGSGKTVTSVYGFEKLRHAGRAKKVLVVVPSGLRANYAEEGVTKFTNSSWQVIGSSSEASKNPGYVRPGQEGDKDYTIISYAMFRRDPQGFIRRSGADTVIADEFHKIRNERAGVFKSMMEVRGQVKNFLGLTASLINNHPKEIATLLTVSEGTRGMSPSQFKRTFTKTIGFEQGFTGSRKKVIGPKNESRLAKITAPRIDYVGIDDLKGKTMPKKKTTNVDVEMSPEQYRLYQLALKKLGPLQEYITRRDKNITVKDANQLFGKIMEARRLSNSVHTGLKNVSTKSSAKRTPKANRILRDTKAHLAKDPNNKVVLYSNLITGGVDVMSAGLTNMGVDHAIFVGKGREVGGKKISGVVRQKGIRDFKAGKKRVIVLSSAGAEGLDLKNATAFYSMDGHFNPERILQAEARARRLGGQDHRVPENRVVDTRRYRSVAPRPKTFLGKIFKRKPPQTTDEWMYNTAGRKHSANKSFTEIVHKPTKYVRKYRDPKTGKIRYVYPRDLQRKKRGGLFGRIFS